MPNKLFVAFLLGILFLRFFLFYFQREDLYKDGEYLSYEATLFSQPQFISNIQRLTVNLPDGEVVYITTSRFPEYGFGDRISVSGTLEKRVLNKNRVVFSQNFPKIELVKNQKDPFFSVLSTLRGKVIEIFNSNLPPDLSSLMLGIVFGVKTNMSKEFMESLRISGVLHVIAASGMNVTMVAGFMSSLLVRFLKRQTALLLTILAIFFYAFFAGLAPSIVRASIMGIIVFSAQILGRQSYASYGLFLTGFVMLFISPQLLFDIGFQLSFAATLGLLYIRPLFDFLSLDLVKKVPFLEDLLVTLSAQLATLPILVSSFGTYSIFSVFVNALVLWTVPLLMILGALGALFGLVFEPLGRIFLYLCLPFLYYFKEIVTFFSRFGLLNIGEFPKTLVIGYYLMILSAVLLRFRKEWQRNT